MDGYTHQELSSWERHKEDTLVSMVKRFSSVAFILAVAAVGAAAIVAPVASAASPAAPTAAGGITVYQAKLSNLSVMLGSSANPTTVATKAVPPGKYLVTGFVGVNSQAGSFDVCAVSNRLNGNDGIFGGYANQTTKGAQVTVSETEVLTLGSGQSIHLTCDDNSGKPGNVVSEAVIEATPVNALH